jgi:FKBP-type peptidyl-prolyl cis-trans isomerase
VIQFLRLSTRSFQRWLPVLLLIGAAACNKSATSPSTSSGQYSQTDLVVGTGTQVNAGNRATVAYTGWLYDTSKTNGKGTQFDSSASYTFTVGAGAVIKGWDQGVPGMKVGGQRRLILPPELAYGSAGAGNGAIPPNATLVFDITLNGVQ